jgi:hypothetical protein
LEFFDFREVRLDIFDVVLDALEMLEASGLERAVGRFQHLSLQVDDQINSPLELAHLRPKDVFEGVAVLGQFPTRNVSMDREAKV